MNIHHVSIVDKSKEKSLLEIELYKFESEVRKLKLKVRRLNAEIGYLVLLGERRHSEAGLYKKNFIDNERNGIFRQKIKPKTLIEIKR